MAPMSLNISPIVRPTILNGNRMSHINGNKKSATRASGQQSVKSIHRRRMAISVFIACCRYKQPARLIQRKITIVRGLLPIQVFTFEHPAVRLCTDCISLFVIQILMSPPDLYVLPSVTDHLPPGEQRVTPTLRVVLRSTN